MKRFVYLFLFISVICHAELPYLARTIESIDYRSQAGQTIALITLSDDSIWQWFPDSYRVNHLRKWQNGDQIIIQSNCRPGIILLNRQHPRYHPHVALTFNSYLLFPTIDSVNEQTIYLSDGSKWECLYSFNKRTLRYWAIGDRIVPVRGIGENFQLINMDIPHDHPLQIERFIEVSPKLPN